MLNHSIHAFEPMMQRVDTKQVDAMLAEEKASKHQPQKSEKKICAALTTTALHQ